MSITRRGNLKLDQIAASSCLGDGSKFATSDGSFTDGNVPIFDTDGKLIDSGTAPGGGGGPYDIVCSLAGKPDASEAVLEMTFTRTVNFAGNFSGSYGTVGTNPTSTATYTVNKNGSSIGTIVVSTGGVVTFTTTSGATQSFAAGDRLDVTAPGTQDATLSDAAFTLAGTR
jgi:hypothetical protein